MLDDSYDYELTKNGVSEERTDGAYILVKYCKTDPSLQTDHEKN